jgi:glycosyltransferase involved in cell wall biosynthesis
MKTKVTIYVLTYNRKNYLFECLNSINNQTYKNFKVIVLDNCSEEDYSEQLFEKYSNELDIEIIKHKNNIGAFRNFMFAWEMKTETDYFMIFHDDDIMHPNLIQTEINLLENNDDLAWVSSKMKGFTKKTLKFDKFDKFKSSYLNTESLVENFIFDGGIHFGSTLYSSRLKNIRLLEELYYKYSIIFDRPFLIELSKYGNVFIVDLKMVLYRIHPGQDSVTGALNFENIFNLYCNYNKLIMGLPNLKKIFIKSWFLFQLYDSNSRLKISERKKMNYLLRQAKSKKLFKSIYLLSLPIMILYYKFINPLIRKIFV